MYTLQAYSRQGIAAQLLKHITAEGKNAHCDLIQISASDDGIKLYTSFGFSRNEHFMQYQIRQ